MTEPATPRQVFERLQRVARENSLEELADLYAPDAVVEIPFAPADRPELRRAEGRETLRARFQAFAKVRPYRVVGTGEVTVHETLDPEVIVVEYEQQMELAATGKTVTFPYVMIMRVRDGLIVHSRDYSNPLAVAEALKGVELPQS